MNLAKRRILMFRTYDDPSIGPKPRQAFSMKELPLWHMEMTQIGVYVKWPEISQTGAKKFHEHLVPFANIQTIKFYEEVEAEAGVVNDLQKTA